MKNAPLSPIEKSSTWRETEAFPYPPFKTILGSFNALYNSVESELLAITT